MKPTPISADRLAATGVAASAYLLRSLDWGDAEALERRLVYECGDDPPAAAILLCEQPGRFLVGRDGSRAHLPLEPDALAAKGFPVHWVARGGGVQLVQPGQVIARVVAPLGALGLTPAGFVDAVSGSLEELATSFGLTPESRDAAIWVRDRAFATHGSAIRFGVGAALMAVNIAPDLGLFRQSRRDAKPRPATSLAREVGARARPALVRQRLIDTISSRLGFARVSVFQSHPALARRTPLHAI